MGKGVLSLILILAVLVVPIVMADTTTPVIIITPVGSEVTIDVLDFQNIRDIVANISLVTDEQRYETSFESRLMKVYYEVLVKKGDETLMNEKVGPVLTGTEFRIDLSRYNMPGLSFDEEGNETGEGNETEEGNETGEEELILEETEETGEASSRITGGTALAEDLKDKITSNKIKVIIGAVFVALVIVFFVFRKKHLFKKVQGSIEPSFVFAKGKGGYKDEEEKELEDVESRIKDTEDEIARIKKIKAQEERLKKEKDELEKLKGKEQ